MTLGTFLLMLLTLYLVLIACAGIFFNITETQHWLIDASPEWQLHPTIRSVHETEARWWVPDTDINEALIHVSLHAIKKLHSED